MLRGGAAALWAAAARLQPALGAVSARQGLAALPAIAQTEGTRRGFSTDLTSFKNSGLRAGPGGRSSVSGIRAVVFGSTGFLGRYVVNQLAKGGTQCILPVRCEEWECQHLKQMGDLGQIIMKYDFKARDSAQIRELVKDANLVINLLGAHQETWNFKFDEVHVDFAAEIAKACAETPSVERLLHVSCLGASSKAPSKRLATKWEGEMAVKSAFPRATIFRPAPMSGNEDKLFNMFAYMAKRQPVLPLVDGGDNKMQVVYVQDVAQAMYNSLLDGASVGETYTLAGPEVYKVKDMVRFTFDTIREGSTAMFMPKLVAKLAAAPQDFLMKNLPPLFINHFNTADAIEETALDLVQPEGTPGLAELNVTPTKIDQGLPIEYLRYYRSGGYDLGSKMTAAHGINQPSGPTQEQVYE